eukprot:TRINITY_DN9562_c0_g1_i1.p1 TRINITY_DN9562_c0_g1~~TRINITY_DN9562_c0_g1_i1.p1  ORF type:complete len:278 (+),score=95.46 TRINITY_DN9562_c0_g1_i1:66-836(+)
MVAINFFNPFNETITVTNINFDFIIGELNTADPFQDLMRLNAADPNVPNPDVAVAGTLPFGTMDFAGAFDMNPSGVNNGDSVLITTLHVAGADQLDAVDAGIVANRLEEGGRNGNVIGMSVNGDFSFDIGDISGNPVVESTMIAFGCDLEEEQMEMGRVGETKGQIELFCDQILADDEDLICPLETPPVMCTIPQEQINDAFFTDREDGQCRAQRHICDINGGCNHVIDAPNCILPDDVLAGPANVGQVLFMCLLS